MKIFIYELVHLDWVIPLTDFLRDSPYAVTFFVHTKMKKDLEESLPAEAYTIYEWVYIEDQPIISLFKLLNDHIKKKGCNLIWVNTNDSKHIIFALLRLKHQHIKLIVNIHEINNFLYPRFSYNIKKALRYFSKRALSKIADAFIVNNDQMRNIIIQQQSTCKPCYVITPVFYMDNSENISKQESFSVVVPGSVDSRRRDYKIVLAAWTIFMQTKKTDKETLLILAGNSNPYGHDILAIINSNPTLKETVRIFDSEIPECQFQRIITDASIIVSPQNATTSISDHIQETYGITKTSGNIYDAIRHGKPLIVPALLRTPEEIASSTIRYASEKALIEIFQNLSNDKNIFYSINQRAIENSQKFSYKAMRKKIDTMITIISTPQ
ncbi:MAG: glycosyltransferase [Chitinophagaceae bacterium]